MAKDYPRAMAAYKVGAEGGDAVCQYQVGRMYCEGYGVAVDFKQARAWLEKAAAQDHPNAVGMLGFMYFVSKGVAPSFRRARELYERAIELGSTMGVQNMQNLTESIANVDPLHEQVARIATRRWQANRRFLKIAFTYGTLSAPNQGRFDQTKLLGTLRTLCLVYPATCLGSLPPKLELKVYRK